MDCANLAPGGNLGHNQPRYEREFSRSVLENPKFRAHLMRRAEEDKLAAHEFVMLHQYGYGKPKDTVAIEDQRRFPTQIVFLSDPGDPLARTIRERTHLGPRRLQRALG